MKRKNFIAGILPTALSFSALAKNMDEPAKDFIVPGYLKPGDMIGITSPAGYITLEDVQPAIKKMQEWGFKIRLGSTIGKRDFTFGGTDAERLQDLQQMLDDRQLKAIMCARGGYGAVRIIDSIDFSVFRKNPKWLIGFSDITVLHAHITSNFHIATLHSKMCNSFPADWDAAEPMQKETIESISKCLTGIPMIYNLPSNANNINGSARGILVGGNLKTIETLAGSKSNLVTTNKILFVEDTGEYLYSIDRMFWNLQRSGKLAELKGLIVGGFKVKKDDVGEEFGQTLEKIVLDKVSKYRYPVCFDFPVGHQKNNYALKCGLMHELIVGKECTLTEMR